MLFDADLDVSHLVDVVVVYLYVVVVVNLCVVVVNLCVVVVVELNLFVVDCCRCQSLLMLLNSISLSLTDVHGALALSALLCC